MMTLRFDGLKTCADDAAFANANPATRTAMLSFNKPLTVGRLLLFRSSRVARKYRARANRHAWRGYEKGEPILPRPRPVKNNPRLSIPNSLRRVPCIGRSIGDSN